MKLRKSWVSVKKALPTKKTRYAGKYGVEVLVFDEQEFMIAGYHPGTCSFDFKTKKFMDLASGPNGSEWIEAFWVTHWMPMPLIPIMSPFRYAIEGRFESNEPTLCGWRHLGNSLTLKEAKKILKKVKKDCKEAKDFRVMRSDLRKIYK